MGFGAFLAAMVPTLVGRVMLTLGMSMVTFTGMSVVMDTLTQRAVSAWGALPASVVQLAGLAGLGEALSIIMGAIATRILIWQLTRSTKMMSVNNG